MPIKIAWAELGAWLGHSTSISRAERIAMWAAIFLCLVVGGTSEIHIGNLPTGGVSVVP